jgi:hypothetical protein
MTGHKTDILVGGPPVRKIVKKNGTQMRALPITLSKTFIPHNAVTTGDVAPTRIRAYGGNVSMRFILRCFMAAAYVLVFLGSAQAQSVTIGETAVLSVPDGGNGNLLAAQSATLAKTATIESLSFYVTAISGNLILGIYDATGPNGGPGALKASTAIFTPATGWNTAKVVTPVSLAVGAYWLAYLPSSSNLSFVKTDASGNCVYYSYNFGNLPSKFSTSPASCSYTTWSFYGTLTASSSGTTTSSGGSPGTTAVNGACGSSNAADLTSKPTANLCSAGTASSVSGSGPWTWTCAGSGGGSTAGCSALLETAGACGSANGGTVSSAPTANLCSAGTASTVTGAGPWSWTCAGSNGGATVSCSDKLASTGTTGSSGTTGTTGPDPTSGLLPSDRDASANWKMAGLQSVGGIPNRMTVCATVKPSGGDDTSNIQTAVNNCPSGQVVLLSVGTFTIGEGKYVRVNKAITVRGSGPCAGASGVGSAPYPASPSMTKCTLIQRTGGAVLGTANGSNPSPHFVLGAGDYYTNVSLGPTTNLAVDGAQGSSTVQVASATGFAVGQIVLIDETSNFGWHPSWIWSGETQWSAPDYRLSWLAQNPTCSAADKDCQGGSTNPGIPCYFNFAGAECDRYTSEIKQIASIGAGPCPGTNCTITFNSPLTISYRASHTAHVALLYGGTSGTTQATTYAGIENMTLQNADGSSIAMVLCAYCWVKNEEDTIMAGYFTNGSIGIVAGFRDQLEGVYTHTGAHPYPGGAGYNWSLDRGSSEILIENSISMQNDKVMVVREAGAGSVIAYNYFDESICGGCSGQTEVGMNASHWLGSHHVLFEGNWSFQATEDPVWGSTAYHTFLRNYISGFRTPFYDYADGYEINDVTGAPDLVCVGQQNCATGIAIAGFDYWQSYIANVIGTPGDMGNWVFNSNNNSQSIWATGYFSGGASVDGEVWTQIVGASACVSPTGDKCPLIRLGNYDYVTKSINDPGSPSSFPNSFYLSSAPAFFGASGTHCTYPWPWVTSTSSTKVQLPTGSGCTAVSGLPAKARFNAGTPFVQP